MKLFVLNVCKGICSEVGICVVGALLHWETLPPYLLSFIVTSDNFSTPNMFFNTGVMHVNCTLQVIKSFILSYHIFIYSFSSYGCPKFS